MHFPRCRCVVGLAAGILLADAIQAHIIIASAATASAASTIITRTPAAETSAVRGIPRTAATTENASAIGSGSVAGVSAVELAATRSLAVAAPAQAPDELTGLCAPDKVFIYCPDGK